MPTWWNGRHTTLKTWRPKGRKGSTPFVGTMAIDDEQGSCDHTWAHMNCEKITDLQYDMCLKCGGERDCELGIDHALI
jgi:hypothetical protein